MIQLSTGEDLEAGDRGWECLRCLEPVTSCERVRGVDEGPSGDSGDGMSDGQGGTEWDEDEDYEELSRDSSGTLT